MKTAWFAFLLPPKFNNYEQAQKAKLLHYMLLTVFLGALVTTYTNFSNGWFLEATILFLLATSTFLGFYLNSKKYFNTAAYILSTSLFVVLGLLLYNGIGLYDTVVFGYPIFIIFVTFLFSRRGLLFSTILSIASVLVIYLLEVNGIFLPKYEVSLLRAIVVAFLFALMALVIWVVHDTWETNLTSLRESYKLTLRGWAQALEYRDGETAGHTRRVAELSVRLAQKLDLQEEDVYGIERGAYMHDIGKMAIPDNILLKHGPLTDDEWKIMKQHPVLSRQFIDEISYLEQASQIAYSHHERWDGSGYPEGLRGEEIPLVARIFTVIDNWDALNSDRPYRKAWPSEDVVAYLQGNAGSMFDPKIVEAFLEVIEDEKPDL